MKENSIKTPEVSSILALGSNLENRHEHVTVAISELITDPHISLRNVSPIMLSEAVGTSLDGTNVDVSYQPDYLNLVIEIGTSLSAQQLLSKIHAIEDQHARKRQKRWDARTLDIDIITYGNAQSSNPDLTLPHPRAKERAFVLKPWSLMNPDATLEGQKVTDLAYSAADFETVRLLPNDFIETTDDENVSE